MKTVLNSLLRNFLVCNVEVSVIYNKICESIVVDILSVQVSLHLCFLSGVRDEDQSVTLN